MIIVRVIMLKIKFIWCLQVSATLFFITINVIEFIRPFTMWPEAVVEMNENQKEIYLSMDIWSKFGLFGGQFVFFTNWTNWLFLGTIIYGWFLGKKVNEYWKNAISTYLLITTIVFFTVLAPFISWGKSAWIDYIWIHEHLIVSLSWFLYIMTSKTKRIHSWSKSVLITVSIPIIYFIFTIIIYFIYDFTIAIYPFLNFANFCSLNFSLPLSITITIIAITIIALGFIATNFLFFEINYHQTTRHYKKKIVFKKVKKMEN